MIDQLNDEQYLRYSRHLLLDDFNVEQQLKLANSKVLLIGAGGLGCPVGLYLAAAGVGQVVINDFDHIELSNLQRQIAHSTEEVGVNKAISLQRSMQAINPELKVSVVQQRCDLDQLEQLMLQVDLVVVATDTFASRFMINQACVKTKTAQINGAAIGFEGQLIAFDPAIANSPCYQCLYSQPVHEQQTCSQAGILGPVVGVVGAMQALMALKFLAGLSSFVVGELSIFDAHTLSWRKMHLAKDQLCECCSK